MLKYSQIISYDTDKYPFNLVLAKSVFKVPKIDKLHLYWSEKNGGRENSYQDNLNLRSLMQRLPDESLFYRVYHKWVEKVLAPKYGFKIRYSAHPKMRVHLGKTGSVSEFHRDADVTKRDEQINCYLPFTDVFDTNTLWCETSYGLGDYQPLNLRYGEALIWDGGYLEHGTFKNKTDFTRVSCDFRFKFLVPELVKPPWSEILTARDAEKCLKEAMITL